jgi:hypothetical protein
VRSSSTRSRHRWRKGEEQRRDRRNRDRAEDHRTGDANLIEARRFGRGERDESAHRRRRERRAEESTDDREDRALGEELANEA